MWLAQIDQTGLGQPTSARGEQPFLSHRDERSDSPQESGSHAAARCGQGAVQVLGPHTRWACARESPESDPLNRSGPKVGKRRFGKVGGGVWHRLAKATRGPERVSRRTRVCRTTRRRPNWADLHRTPRRRILGKSRWRTTGWQQFSGPTVLLVLRKIGNSGSERSDGLTEGSRASQLASAGTGRLPRAAFRGGGEPGLLLNTN